MKKYLQLTPGRRVLFLLLFLTFAVDVSGEPMGGGIRINEFMADNVTVFPDNADFDDYSDWVELFNPGDQAVSLNGYYLTDDLTAPTKWAFPLDASIPAGGFLTVRADGFNAGPGETHVRGYYPWGSTFTTRRFHTSFKLSSSGEELGLFRLDTPAQLDTLIARNSVWHYLDKGTDPGADWTSASFDDSAWASGPAVLGYGDSWISTTVSFGPSSNSKYPTTHFRRHFTVDDPLKVGDISLNVQVDDSAVIYINGAEVARLRMPEGTVSYLDYSGQTVHDENVFENVELTSVPLQAGDNVLAVEVHQEGGNSSDISFDAELTATLITGTAIPVDSVSFGQQTADVSYGRDSDSPDGWSFFGVATPNGPNTTAALALPAQTASPVVASLDSGFYTGEQSVELVVGDAAEVIHYTLDGSDPGPDSPVYTDPLTIDGTTILRARAYEDGLIPGPILTRSCFLNGDADPKLPVFSFVADPTTLFGDDIGIYENDTSYPFKGREIPIRLEMFEADGSAAFAVSAGARIAGENIWQKAQKPFNIYMRSKYGDDLVQYQLFPGEAAATFGEFNLRNGGDDWEETLLRDGMMPSILAGQMDASFYSYRPSILFLNGEFWGIYNIRKRFDPVYFANQHYISEGDYDLVQYAHVDSGSVVLHADTGSTESYELLKDFVTANDPADDAIYDQILEQVNVDSFIDYVVATDFAMNTSWPHNREFWRGHAPGSKWEWIINDFDRGFNISNVGSSLIDNFRGSYTLFQRLDNNPRFVNRLIQRYAAHLGGTFNPTRFAEILDSLSAEQEGEIQRHIDRWSSRGGISNAAKRMAELDEIKQFVAERPSRALDRLQSELNLNHPMAALTFAASPMAGGRVLVAGVPMAPEYNDTVDLFLDTPVELSAQPAPGYAFSGWSTGETEPTIEITMAGAMSISADFTPDAETVLPNTLSADITLSASESPYVVDGDLLIEAGATLTVEPGVDVRMTPHAGITVHGILQVNGSKAEPVRFVSRTGEPWGNIGFVDTAGTSTLSNVVIRGATVSRLDPLNLKGAISGYNADIVLDHVDIEGPQPIFARFGSTTLRDSRIHVTFTGDGINIKQGAGLVERSTFPGNDSPDTDAIDFDGVTDGVIRDNRIYSFRGFNSDGIDVGEGCVNLLVSGNRVYNNSDKGISVGQASEVFIERNLIAACVLGIGIKDAGSIAHVDQNTFVQNDVGVAVYEKNLGAGGGGAVVTNTIFSRSKDAPVTVDALSALVVSYSLSDTTPVVGEGNFVADPMFTDPGIYDFSIASGSPAIDSGDPGHAPDGDGSRADVGAYYEYSPDDYPFLPPNVVVINEVLAHSSESNPDWIELHNTSAVDVNIGGWFLSDSGSDLRRYRIADDTILPGDGYVVFYEDTSFGEASVDPGRLVPFALSENGESVFLFAPGDGVMLDYLEEESFGPSATDVSKGRYFKASSNTYNFVAMAEPTPGAANSDPLVGPVVISEIMYHPSDNADAEFIELTNISDEPVTLYEDDKDESWKMTDGVEFSFPKDTPVTMEPGERILLARSEAAVRDSYTIPDGTRLFEWTSGALDNDGERLEISDPGDLDVNLIRHFVRVDRVNYDDEGSWPIEADGGGMSLTRVEETAYGNDSANWTAAVPNPGAAPRRGFDLWVLDHALPADLAKAADDAEGDGIVNLLEYVYGNDPMTADVPPSPTLGLVDGRWVVSFAIAADLQGVDLSVQMSTSLSGGDWIDVEGAVVEPGENGATLRVAVDADGLMFFRLKVVGG